jgi:transposase
MDNGITMVGMDVHKNDIKVAVLQPRKRKPEEWSLVNEPKAVRRLSRKLKRLSPGKVRCCYEAGPCGYTIQRQLVEEGIECEVIAPSLIPRKPGERVKTDRRDARKLASLLRAGLLTPVKVPGADEEAVRDLSRAREDAKQDLMRARNRLGKFLLRHGLIYRAGKTWTQTHHRWLRGLTFKRTSEQVVFENYLLEVVRQEERKAALVKELERVSQQAPYAEPVGWLRCFRGIDTVTAMSLLAELQDLRRFPSARELMSYLGLVPSEASSGGTERRGGITKTGNCRVRRLLVEAAWHARHRPALSKDLCKRRQGQPPGVIALADRAMTRLHGRFWRYMLRGKPAKVAVTAVARELVGFLWAVMTDRVPTTV